MRGWEGRTKMKRRGRAMTKVGEEDEGKGEG